MADEPLIGDLLVGRVAWIFPDDFDVDLIVGVHNIREHREEVLLRDCMRSFDPGFVDKVAVGDFIVGGRNFGYGHPHYPAMRALRAAGIVGVIAESFAPGFFRGETFNGVPLVRCPGIASSVVRWDMLEVQWKTAHVTVVRTSQVLRGEPPSSTVVEVLEAGGRHALLLRRLGPRIRKEAD